jgi:hypothetical protein
MEEFNYEKESNTEQITPPQSKEEAKQKRKYSKRVPKHSSPETKNIAQPKTDSKSEDEAEDEIYSWIRSLEEEAVQKARDEFRKSLILKKQEKEPKAVQFREIEATPQQEIKVPEQYSALVRNPTSYGGVPNGSQYRGVPTINFV